MSTEALPNLAGKTSTSPTAWADGAGIVSDIANTTQSIKDGDALGAGIAGAASALDALAAAADPFAAVISAGLGWLVEHIGFLREPLDKLAGDPGAIQAQANTWSNIGTETSKVTEDYRHSVESDIPQWTGDAADAYRGQAEQLGQELSGFAQAAEGMSAGVAVAGVLVGTERGIIRDMITEFLAKLIERGLIALAGAVETLGATVAAFVADAVAEGAILAGKCASRIAKLLQKLAQLASKMGKLGHGLEQLIGKLARFAHAKAGSAGGFAGTMKASEKAWKQTGEDIGAGLGGRLRTFNDHLMDDEVQKAAQEPFGTLVKDGAKHPFDDSEGPSSAQVEFARQVREGADREREHRAEAAEGE